MPHRSTLVLVLALAAVVRAIPVDEISARNGIGGQADPISAAARNCTSSLADCNMSEFSGMSLLKIAPGKHTRVIPSYVSSDTPCRKCREADQPVNRFGKWWRDTR